MESNANKWGMTHFITIPFMTIIAVIAVTYLAHWFVSLSTVIELILTWFSVNYLFGFARDIFDALTNYYTKVDKGED